MQQEHPHFSPVRRLLFPYSGEEPLTRAQGIRVVVTWAIFFPVVLMIGTVPVVLLIKNTSLQDAALLLLLVFLAGVAIFGVLASFVVYMMSRSARYFQAQKLRQSTEAGNPSGGRYGS